MLLRKAFQLLQAFHICEVPGAFQLAAAVAEVPCTGVHCTLYSRVCVDVPVTWLSNMSLVNYVIPKLSANRPPTAGVADIADPREANLKHYASIYAKRCIYCRVFHSENSYCFQIKPTIMSRHSSGRKRHRTPTPSDSEESDSRRDTGSGSDSEEGEICDKSGSDNDSTVSELDDGDKLKEFFSTMGRVDDKDVTLTLNKQTVKLYFTTVLGRGKFDRDGRDKMRDKYFLDPHVFDKFSPPDLLGTKLHLLDGLDFSGLSTRLQVTHSKLRDVVKVLLKHFQHLGENQSAFGELQIGKVYNEHGDLSAEYELPDISAYQVEVEEDSTIAFSEENFRRLVAEHSAVKKKEKDTQLNYRFVRLVIGCLIISFV